MDWREYHELVKIEQDLNRMTNGPQPQGNKVINTIFAIVVAVITIIIVMNI
jgi:hypothetical protein